MINIFSYIFKKIMDRREFEASGKIHPITGVKIFPCGRAYVRMFRCGGYVGYKACGKTWLVHIHVAELFIPNPDRKPIVNHKDGNKRNFYADNLEWATYSENTRHAYMMGLISRAKLNKEKVIDIRKSSLRPETLANIYGVTVRTIYKVINNQSWIDVK